MLYGMDRKRRLYWLQDSFPYAKSGSNSLLYMIRWHDRVQNADVTVYPDRPWEETKDNPTKSSINIQPSGRLYDLNQVPQHIWPDGLFRCAVTSVPITRHLPAGWKRSRGRPRNPWLSQIGSERTIQLAIPVHQSPQSGHEKSIERRGDKTQRPTSWHNGYIYGP